MPEDHERGSAPTYEELRERNAALEELVVAQQARITELEGRLADLERRLGRNPRNSSMPPSAEGFGKPPAANRAQRRAAKRKPGKQPGAEGKHLAKVEHPDEILVHVPGCCDDCGADLVVDGELVGVETRQVFDTPPVHGPHVTEHQMQRRRCRCGHEQKAEAPPEATAPTCYGPRVRALACYLAVYQHLPYERMAELFSDLFGIEISVGALAKMVADAGGLLGVFKDVVADLLRFAPSVHFDETGARVEGSLHWVHVASTSLLTLLECHKRRGKVAIDAMGIMEKMSGVAVHDGWAPYRTYDVVHGLCNAHHVRELEAIGAAEHQGWASEMIDLLYEVDKVVDKARAAGKDHLSRSTIGRLRRRYDLLVAKGRDANPAVVEHRRHGVDKDAHNLLVRLEAYADDVLRSSTDFNVSWSNNQAERDIRLVKLQQKISGSWRALDGARNYCSIRSYISTMKKQDHDVLNGLRQLFLGQVWLPSGVGRT
ncbi:MAG: IS66 family transposase [Actinomycetota bacterium]|nr:IS66 family transposase [Actinomycetota bacterium]